MAERMARRTLNGFTRDIWAQFDGATLVPRKITILRRRQVLARQASR